MSFILVHGCGLFYYFRGYSRQGEVVFNVIFSLFYGYSMKMDIFFGTMVLP
jgi:hypothetical protein